MVERCPGRPSSCHGGQEDANARGFGGEQSQQSRLPAERQEGAVIIHAKKNPACSLKAVFIRRAIDNHNLIHSDVKIQVRTYTTRECNYSWAIIATPKLTERRNPYRTSLLPLRVRVRLFTTLRHAISVFARRLGTSEPRWENGKWIWDRFAVATTPRLPTWSQGVQERIPIPWPEPPKPPQMEPTQYDTPEDVVAEVTYAPSPVPEHPSPSLAAGSLRKNCADDYVRMLRADIPYDQTAFPAELLLTRELSNPHSRTKKRIRYLTAQARQRDLLKHYIDEELKSLNGRTRREARAEATFRWRARIEDDRKAELKRRWVQRGQGARLQRKQERQTKKLEKEKKRLRDLVLTAAKNQVLPEVQA